MDSTVYHELVKSKAGYFAANRVESGKHDCLGGVVYDDLNSCRSLKSAYVASFSTDDTTFDLIVVNMEYCY